MAEKTSNKSFETSAGSTAEGSAKKSGEKKSIAVIDGNSLIHRAYHAIPPNMMSPQGIHTNAVYGFLSMFIRMISDFHPWGVIVCFDKGKPKVRMEMYPKYKAGRPPQDPELHEQFPLAKELLASLSVPVVELEGWEGDDLLGTLAKQGSEEGYRMLLVTGDRDMYQLSSDDVAVVSTKKGMSEVQIMTPEAVRDLYGGITPDLVPDFYGLKGDSSDNIPGVPGVGPKKAQTLIEEFGSLEGVLEHTDEIPGKMGENIRAHIDDARLSKEVAIIRTDAPVDVDFDDARFPDFDEAVARETFSKLGFTTIAQRLFRTANAEMGEEIKRSVSADGLRSGEIEGGFRWRELAPREGAGAAGGAAKDGEAESSGAVGPSASASVASGSSGTFTFQPILEGKAAEEALAKAKAEARWLGVGFSESEEAGTLFDEGNNVWISTEEGMLHFVGQAAKDMLLSLFADHRVASCNIKELIHEVYPANLDEEALLNIEVVSPDRIFDASVAAYLLASTQSSYTPSVLALEYLNQTLPEEEPTGAKGAQVAATIARLVQPLLKTKLDETGSNSCFETIEMPLVPVLCQMEREGMEADAAIFHQQAQELAKDISSLAASIYERAGEEFNIDSPAQLSHILFDVLELPTDGLKKTKKGFYSTNAKVLTDLSHTYEIVSDVLRYREENKILNTYLLALPETIKSDGRIHTTLNQTVTATGRLSSSDPNLQNIPIRSELGRRVRAAFTVPDEYVFLTCDYSQIELRLLAHLSGDENLIKAFKEGEDFHAETASRVFGLPLEEITPDLRSRAKAVNFGIVYGQQAFGLSQALGIPRKEAQEMIDAYFAAYPAVRAFLDQTVAEAVQNGFVTTMYNRRRLTPDVTSSNRMLRAAAERTAMNHPMQGTAADIIKIAMIRVEKELQKGNFKSRLILQIHDELDLQVPKDELDEVSKLVRETMEDVVELSVPLVADISYGKNWADAK